MSCRNTKQQLERAGVNASQICQMLYRDTSGNVVPCNCLFSEHRDETEQQTPVARFDQLLRKTIINPDPNVFEVITLHLWGPALTAVNFNDEKLVKIVYERARQYPKTSTAAVALPNYKIDGFYQNMPSGPIFALKDFHIPKLLKPITDAEEIESVLEYMENEITHSNIVPIEEYHRYAEKLFLVMPVLEMSSEVLSPVSHPEVMKKIYEEISSALDYLHNKGFVFVDLKPSNICVHQGHFILVDIASVVCIGSKRIKTTEMFLPLHFDCSSASLAMDWWMLATTMLWFVKRLPVPHRLDKNEIKEKLINCEYIPADICNMLLDRLQ